MLLLLLSILNVIRSALAMLSCGWVLVLVWPKHGVLGELVALFLFSFLYKIGTAPQLAVAATILCVYFGVIGWWFPILSYTLAIVPPVLALVLAKQTEKDESQKHTKQSQVENQDCELEEDQTI